MNKLSEWKIPKWPFLLADAVLILVAAIVVWKARHPISHFEIGIATGCVALGALLGCLPFMLEYRATGKLIELDALGEVSEKIQNVKAFGAQIAAVTEQWSRLHETTQISAEKTTAAAKEIADRITAEVRDFSEFQKKMNDAEKGALRLEVEKLRRAEGDWLQVVARILDHIFALHTAAARSGQTELIAQISSFQNACRDAARRVGFTLFDATPDETFDAQKHRAYGVENPPATAIVAETLAPGISFQGRLIRPALVRLRENNSAPEMEKPNETVEEKTAEEFPFETD